MRPAKNYNLMKKTTPTEMADQYGSVYTQIGDNIKGQTLELDVVKAEIKAFARSDGSTAGNKTSVVGSQWEVGFLSVSNEPKIDAEAAKRILSASVLNQCSVSSIDPAKFTRLVEKNLITTAQMKAILIPGASYERISVTRVKGT